MRLYDGTKLVEIKMSNWTGTEYTPDWSQDFFEAGSLATDDEHDAYIVDDVDYCIDMANDWRNAEGDFYEPDADPEEVKNRDVDVEYLEV